MKKDKALNVFLIFILIAILFVGFFPIYFTPDKTYVRTVSIAERLFSMLFVLLWIALCVYSSWKKRLPLFIGGVLYSVLAYFPEWFLPGLSASALKDPGMINMTFKFLFEKLYELVNAPFTGISILFPESFSRGLGKTLLPVLLISYAGTQLFRFYRNAYLAEQLHLEDTMSYGNPALAIELGLAPLGEMKPPRSERPPVSSGDRASGTEKPGVSSSVSSGVSSGVPSNVPSGVSSGASYDISFDGPSNDTSNVASNDLPNGSANGEEDKTHIRII